MIIVCGYFGRHKLEALSIYDSGPGSGSRSGWVRGQGRVGLQKKVNSERVEEGRGQKVYALRSMVRVESTDSTKGGAR